jgi:hypothetical protein
VRRRRLLVALAGLAAGSAGCAGTAADGPAATPTGERSRRITDTSFAASDGECSPDEGAARVSFDGDAVRVDGRLATPTPCHGAALADARLDGDRLLVAVRTTDSTAGACAQCLGTVSYDATVQVAGGLPTEVRVEHDGEAVTTAERPTRPTR